MKKFAPILHLALYLVWQSTAQVTETVSLVIPDYVFHNTPSQVPLTAIAAITSSTSYFRFDCDTEIPATYCQPDGAGNGEYFYISASAGTTTFDLKADGFDRCTGANSGTNICTRTLPSPMVFVFGTSTNSFFTQTQTSQYQIFFTSIDSDLAADLGAAVLTSDTPTPTPTTVNNYFTVSQSASPSSAIVSQITVSAITTQSQRVATSVVTASAAIISSSSSSESGNGESITQLSSSRTSASVTARSSSGLSSGDGGGSQISSSTTSAPLPSSASASSSSTASSSFSTNQKIGTGVGIVAFAGVASVIGFFLFRYRRKRRAENPNPSELYFTSDAK